MSFVTEIVTKAILGWVLMSHGANGGPGGGGNVAIIITLIIKC
jgi:hypothetical protein